MHCSPKGVHRLLERIKDSIEKEDFFTWFCYRHPFSGRWISHYHSYSQSCKGFFALTVSPCLLTSKATHYFKSWFFTQLLSGSRHQKVTWEHWGDTCRTLPAIPQLFNYLCESEAVTLFVFWSVELAPGKSIFAFCWILPFSTIVHYCLSEFSGMMLLI